ncbi:hypothetical protein ACFX13_038541 [Malus domestica]
MGMKRIRIGGRGRFSDRGSGMARTAARKLQLTVKLLKVHRKVGLEVARKLSIELNVHRLSDQSGKGSFQS